MPKRKNAGVPPAAVGGTARRSSSKKIRYLSVVNDNCALNAAALIEKAKAIATYGDVPWDESRWDITDSENVRGHKGRRYYLYFTQHRDEKIHRGRQVGEPFDNFNLFADLAKAMVRLRRQFGGQVAANQQEIIIGFRYIYEQLAECGYDLARLTPEHLDEACKAAEARETEVSQYKRKEKIEEIARILDNNGLTRTRLDYFCSFKKRPSSMSDDRLDDPVAVEAKASKLPPDGFIKAIAQLYHTIPITEWSDRVRICLITILVLTGFRIGELLCLPARRVETEKDTGRRYIVYYPEKGSPPEKKWLMTESGEIADAAMSEILTLTQPARDIASWLFDHPGEVWFEDPSLLKDTMTLAEVTLLVGLRPENTPKYMLNCVGKHFCLQRKIPIARGQGEQTVSREDLISALARKRFDQPVHVVEGSGERLLLKDALACVFLHAFNSRHRTLKYVVLPILEGAIDDFLTLRESIKTVFERYDIRNEDGTPFNESSHKIRHWLNDILDKGGLSDVTQARYFARKNARDNRAYQHMTSRDRVRKVREDLKNGNLLGPVAETLKRIPIAHQDAFLELRVRAAHISSGIVCLHDFGGSPCPYSMGCHGGCEDYHWETDDPMMLAELEETKKGVLFSLDASQRALSEEASNADSWVQYNLKKLAQINESISKCKSRLEGKKDA